MALSSSGFHDALAYMIIKETDAKASTVSNISTAAGKLYSVEVYNPHGYAVYLKIFFTAGATLGSTVPNIQFRVNGVGTEHFEIPSGVEFDELGFGVSKQPSMTDTTDPTDTDGDIAVTFICS